MVSGMRYAVCGKRWEEIHSRGSCASDCGFPTVGRLRLQSNYDHNKKSPE